MYQSRSRSEENGKQETKLKFIVERERVRQYNCVSLNCPIFATTTKEIYWRSSRDKESDIINLYFTILHTTNIHDSALLETFYKIVVYFPCISPFLFTILVETSLQTNHQYLQIWGVPE